MPGPQIVPLLPLYIPPDVDINAVNAAVSEDGVSAPEHDVAGLRQVVAEAKEQGIDLKIVVIANNPPVDTPVRDVATEVGLAHPGSTVLAMSPSFAGTYSPQFDRVTLEAGEDVAETGNPVLSSQNFLNELTKPDFPWTAMTIFVIIAVIAAVGVTRLLQVSAKRAAQPAPAGADDVE